MNIEWIKNILSPASPDLTGDPEKGGAPLELGGGYPAIKGGTFDRLTAIDKNQ